MKKHKRFLINLIKIKSNKVNIKNKINKKNLAIIGICIFSLIFMINMFTGNQKYHLYEDSEEQLQYKRQQEFIAKLVPIAEKNYKEFGVFPSVTIAQAIHESGWGESGLFVQANNLFGIKAGVVIFLKCQHKSMLMAKQLQQYQSGEYMIDLRIP